jgi:hypothetical protein
MWLAHTHTHVHGARRVQDRRLRRWQVWRECLYLCAKQTGVWYVVCDARRGVRRESSRVKWSEVCFGDANSLPPASLPASRVACVLQHEQAWQAATMARRRGPGGKEGSPETSYPSTGRAHVTQRTATSQPSWNCYTTPIYTNEQDIYFGLPSPLRISTCSHFHINLIHLPPLYSFVRLRFSPQAMVTSV